MSDKLVANCVFLNVFGFMCVPSRLECKEERSSIVFFSKNFDLRLTSNKTYFEIFYRTPMEALTKSKKSTL